MIHRCAWAVFFAVTSGVLGCSGNNGDSPGADTTTAVPGPGDNPAAEDSHTASRPDTAETSSVDTALDAGETAQPQTDTASFTTGESRDTATVSPGTEWATETADSHSDTQPDDTATASPATDSATEAADTDTEPLPSDSSPLRRWYTYMYYRYGVPTPLKGRRPQSEANLAARRDPDVVIETGFYTAVFDCDDLQIAALGPTDGTTYLGALHAAPLPTQGAAVTLAAQYGGTWYQCTSGQVDSGDEQLVRLVESTRFVQRFDHIGISCTAPDGSPLPVAGRLEVTAWPDRLTVGLDFGDSAEIAQTAVEITPAGGPTFRAQNAGPKALVSWHPHTGSAVEPMDPQTAVVEARAVGSDAQSTYYYDPWEAAVYVEVPAPAVRYPDAQDRFDEYRITLANPTDEPVVLPLVFDEVNARAITGGVMLLANPDGTPSGIPVQIAKNWHGTTSDTPHHGSWVRGYTAVPLDAGETRTFSLRIVYGYWADAGAISHASLSLIGWPSKNWKWEESALGAWGESSTYNPTLDAGGAFVDDVRPAFTLSRSGDTHGWTENVGGADMLIYRDSGDTYHWLQRIKTAFFWVGPNMTDIWYSGVTDDGAIEVTYRVRAMATRDYQRRVYAYRYRFLQDVVAPTRLVFHQMAADYYTGPESSEVHWGDLSGHLGQRAVQPGGNAYVGDPILMSDRWLAVVDTSTGGTDPVVPSANRGIVYRKATRNGEPLAIYAHPYGRTWGSDRLLFDFAPESVHQSFAAGDVVEGEFVFVLPPKNTAVYWGQDPELQSRLDAVGEATWQLVFDEARYNHHLAVTAHTGTLLNDYPVEIAAATGDVLADLTISGGGIGHLPIVVRSAPAFAALAVQRRVGDQWVDLENVDHNAHSYYQGVVNDDTTVDYAFSIHRPGTDLAAAWRIRIVAQ